MPVGLPQAIALFTLPPSECIVSSFISIFREPAQNTCSKRIGMGVFFIAIVSSIVTSIFLSAA
ncbi:hypothetical protein I315_06898 [Cryptococcus gattii Ru294]|nr:hypothetical protein I315_06898 [Cryptococcus gattii Ru294]